MEPLAASLGDGEGEKADVLLSLLRTVYGRLAGLSSGVLWFDERGDVVFAEPEDAISMGANIDQVKGGLDTDVRSVSMPYLSPTTGYLEAARIALSSGSPEQPGILP